MDKDDYHDSCVDWQQKGTSWVRDITWSLIAFSVNGKDITVNFPQQSHWTGLLPEMDRTVCSILRQFWKTAEASSQQSARDAAGQLVADGEEPKRIVVREPGFSSRCRQRTQLAVPRLTRRGACPAALPHTL
ncbi:E3 ubiquitin-protein ligase HERC2 [Camelus dromedarius]|uniref:E3 ubiquitin-protein ligase HERC2 n=1 Tax=Camelus dromedarius TaxID=9838 RepID=A0A5N4CRX2_CAMDR|nr:E3 ubiquitin-protein ligase HERC2 [Camelus dromedarius]